jgi:hypothetical protein
VSSLLRSDINDKIDRINRSCIDIQNAPEDLEDVAQKLTVAIAKIRADTESKIQQYKEDFRREYGNMEEYRQNILQELCNAQRFKDSIKQNVDKFSDIKLIKEEKMIMNDLERLNDQVEEVRHKEPFKLEDLEERVSPL